MPMVVSGSSKASSWTGGRGTVYLYLFEVFVADDRGGECSPSLAEDVEIKRKSGFWGDRKRRGTFSSHNIPCLGDYAGFAISVSLCIYFSSHG